MFLFKKLTLVVTVILLLSWSYGSNAQESSLTIQPNQCISVHQGEQCFVDISLNWQTETLGDYCLYSSQQPQPLLCWQNSLSGQFAKEIKANENVDFYLKMQGSDNILAQQSLKMAWVYKKSIRARASWRLF